MANFPKMKLTNAGLGLLANVQAGADNLVFTKTVLGDGTTTTPVTSLTALVSPKVEIAIAEGKRVGDTTYQIASFFSNAEVKTGFWWREIGVFAKGNDGKEILYCYSNAGDAGDYIPVGSDERVEKYIYQSLAIGNAESVTAEINASDSFILTAEKGKADGVAPLGADGKIGTEYMPVIVSSHIADTTKHITATERTSWNNKAPSGHGLGDIANSNREVTLKSIMSKGCGFYQAYKTTGVNPVGSNLWVGLLQLTRDISVNNETGVQVLLSDKYNEPQMWMRSVAAGIESDWVEMLHSGNYEDFMNVKIFKGSYLGVKDQVTLNFDFNPKILIVQATSKSTSETDVLLIMINGASSPKTIQPVEKDVAVTWGNNSVHFIGEDNIMQLANRTYHYVAIG